MAAQLRRQITPFGSGWRGSFEEGLVGPDIPEEFAALHPNSKKTGLSFQWLSQGFVRHEQEDFATHLPGYLLPDAERRSVLSRSAGFLRRNWKVASAVGLLGLYLTKPLSIFSGRDDDANTIEGLGHRGIAQKLRKQNTEFGSGWDPLRKIASAAGTTLEKMVRTPSFREALASGKIVRELGEGSFGKVSLMESSFRVGEQEHKFQFARKHVADSEGLFSEVKKQRKLQDLNAPSVYGFSGKNVFMEPIHGKSAMNEMLMGRTIPESAISDLEKFLPEMHRRGIAHMDLNKDFNRIYKLKGSMGERLPHNIIITPEGRAAVIDYGLATKSGKPNKNDLLLQKVFSGGEKFSTNAEFDMDLVASLRRNRGQLSDKAISTANKLDGISGSITEQTIPAKRKMLPSAKTAPAAQVDAARKMFSAGISGGKKHRTTFRSASGL